MGIIKSIDYENYLQGNISLEVIHYREKHKITSGINQSFNIQSTQTKKDIVQKTIEITPPICERVVLAPRASFKEMTIKCSTIYKTLALISLFIICTAMASWLNHKYPIKNSTITGLTKRIALNKSIIIDLNNNRLNALCDRVWKNNLNVMELSNLIDPEKQRDFVDVTTTAKEVTLTEQALGGIILKVFQINLGNRQLFKYFVDTRKEVDFLLTKEKFNTMVNNLNFIINKNLETQSLKLVEIRKNKEYVGVIDERVVFYINEQDAAYYNVKPLALANNYKSILEYELKLLKAQANNTSKIVSGPSRATASKKQHSFTILKNIQQKLSQNLMLVYQNRIIFNNIAKDLYVYKNQEVKTPTIYPITVNFITSLYGLRVHPLTRKYVFHTGIDFGIKPGYRIAATAEGKVVVAHYEKGYGNVILIYHGKGLSTLYAHCSRFYVKRGQFVSKGQLIALSGATGTVAGPHLHYEVRQWNQPVNPTIFLTNDYLKNKLSLNKI